MADQPEVVGEDTAAMEFLHPKPPEYRRPSDLTRMSIKNKKLRFLQSYEARMGNESLACDESGIDPDDLPALIEGDPDFAKKLERAKKRNGDRAALNLHDAVGTVKLPRVRNTRISENTLLQVTKAANKELFNDDGAAGGGVVVVQIDVPRPAAESKDRPAQLQPAAQADGSSPLPS